MVVTQVDQHVYTGILFSEFNPIEAPKLNEKVLKDKRKKLRETFSRVYRLYVSLPTVKYLFFWRLLNFGDIGGLGKVQ